MLGYYACRSSTPRSRRRCRAGRHTSTSEVQLAPIRSAIYVPAATLYGHFRGQDVTPQLAELDALANQTIDDLLWWTKALKSARASVTTLE